MTKSASARQALTCGEAADFRLLQTSNWIVTYVIRIPQFL